MSRHRHDWIAVDGEGEQYRCADCPATRDGRHGTVTRGRQSPLEPDTITARPTNPRRAPTLDDYDQEIG
jgi:hypothetical protein